MYKYYIGIDNGVTGGVFCLNQDGEPVGCEAIRKVVYKGSRPNSVDCVHLHDTLLQLCDGAVDKTAVLLERPLGAKSYKAAISMFGAFHTIATVLDLMGMQYDTIVAKKWQSLMYLGIPRTAKGKARSKLAVSKYFPEETFKHIPKAQLTDVMDAGLIAKYLHLQNTPETYVKNKEKLLDGWRG